MQEERVSYFVKI